MKRPTSVKTTATARLSVERLESIKADGVRLTPLDALEKCFVVRF